MRRLKKICVCLSMALVGALMAVSTVSAKSGDSGYFNDVRDSYTEPIYGLDANYTNDQYEALWEQCRVINPESLYMDTGIINAARKYIGNSKYSFVADLRYINTFKLGYELCDEKTAFNYGFVAYHANSESDNTSVCKCSSSDFNRLKKYYGKDGKKFTVHNSDCDVKYSYDPDKDILTVETYWK